MSKLVLPLFDDSANYLGEEPTLAYTHLQPAQLVCLQFSLDPPAYLKNHGAPKSFPVPINFSEKSTIEVFHYKVYILTVILDHRRKAR